MFISHSNIFFCQESRKNLLSETEIHLTSDGLAQFNQQRVFFSFLVGL